MIKSEIALRIEMVEELLKKGQIKTAQEYFNILNQRQLMPMQKFKKGDKVKALVDESIRIPLLVKGQILTIDSYIPTLNSDYFVVLEEFKASYPWHNFKESDFELESLNSGSALRTYSNTVTANGGILQPRTGYQANSNPQSYGTLKTKADAKKLLKHEYDDKGYSEDEIRNDFKTVFNLSDDEIKAIIKEIEDENAKYQYTSQYISFNPGYSITLPNGLSDLEGKKPETNGNVCIHQWETYTGLSHTDTYCKLCNLVKK